LLDLDFRLFPVMVEAWDHDDWGVEFACLLRLAYGAGYTDALTEAVPAQLCREHRLRIPERRSAG
jgi:hypothetical protein